MSTILPIAIRPATKTDHAYIHKTFSIDYHKTYPITHVPVSIYVPHQAKVIDRLIETCHIEMACLDDEPDIICGYLISQPLSDDSVIVHWGQVKGIFRRMGIMQTLLDSIKAKKKSIICTHIFKLFPELKERYHLIYDPTIAEGLIK